MKHIRRRLLRSVAFGSTLGWLAAPATADAAEVTRRGLQIEGMIGATGCIPGRAPCRQRGLMLDGGTRPSFGIGAAIGFRPVKWFMIGGLYRYGMFNPAYQVAEGARYRYAAQHTVALMLRPILPIWRMDLGLNVAPGFGRQVFRLSGDDRDVSQGFSLLVGPTIDFYLTRHFFLGAELDFIFNTRKKVCQHRDSGTICSDNPTREIAPVHQVLFGLHLGATFG